MKNWIILIAVVAVGIGSVSADEYRNFLSADGKAIRGKIEKFDAKRGSVTIQRDNKKRATVPITVFSEKDQSFIREWALLESFRSESILRVSCDKEIFKKWKEESSVHSIKFQETGYNIAFENRGKAPITGLKVEYKIFYEQEKTAPGQSKKALHKLDKKGIVDLSRLEGKEKRVCPTGAVQLEFYEFNAADYYYENGDPESTYGELKGIWIQLSVTMESGEKVVRNVFKPESLRGKYSW